MGKPAVIVSVEKQPGVDTVRLTQEVERALAELTATLPDGIKADNILFRQANFIETSIDNVKKVLLEAVGGRGHRAVRLPAQCAHDRDLAHRHSRLDPVDRHHLPSDGAVHQHHDAGRPRHRHRRTGRRRRGRRREHLPPPAREPRAGQSAQRLRRRGLGQPGSPLRHRLCHDDHRAGLRAAVRAVRHRRPAVRAAGPGLHHLDPGQPRRLDHADAGHGLLHAAGPEAARRA